MVSPILIETMELCVLGHIEKVDLNGLNVDPSEGSCCLEHVFLVFPRQSENDMDAHL
jgi:hypothetical protein